MVQEFAIIGQQRSGTTVLSDLFNRHPNFYVAKEIFHPGDADSFQAFCALRLKEVWDGSLSQRSVLFGEFVESLKEKSGKAIIGYNVKYASCHHLDGDWRLLTARPGLFDFLALRGAGIIHVVRSNVFRSALSNIRASATGVWHSNVKCDTARPAIEIDVRRLSELITSTRLEMAAAASLISRCSNVMTVFYEDLFSDDKFDSRQIDRLAQFFSTDASLFNGIPQLARLSAKDWREGVLNWRDVESAVGAEFPGMLVD